MGKGKRCLLERKVFARLALLFEEQTLTTYKKSALFDL